MTRINLIPVSELADQHLLAEHREIKRIPNVIKNWKANFDNIPEKFCLWKWHVKFFYNKVNFLMARYLDLYDECKKRWFDVEYYWTAFSPVSFFLDEKYTTSYIPSHEDIFLSQTRINEKLNEKPLFYKYYWKPYIN